MAPSDLKENLAKANIELESVAWFKVPAKNIEGEKSIAFTYHRDRNIIPDFKEYERFNISRMDVYRTVPKETIEYYKQKKAENMRPLLFHLVPHILYKGTIDTLGLEVVYS